MANTLERLRENVERIRQQVDEAANTAGRQASDICVIGVTKYVDLETTAALIELGWQDLGESRPQQLWTKADALSEHSIRWHMIGHLQRNKAKRTLPLLSWLHSGDSMRLLESIEKELSPEQKVSVLIEVNISGDANKHGFQPQEVEPALPHLAKLRHIEIKGLMGMASREGGRSQAQADFASLRQLRDSLRKNCPEPISLDELSMGMSQDFDLAIREGATMIRVGSSLFEGIDA